MSTIWREDTPASTEVFRVQVAFSRRIEVRSTRKWALSWSRDKLRKAQTHAHTTWRESDGERLSPFTAKPTLTTQPRSRSFPASPVPSPPPLYTYTHTDTYTHKHVHRYNFTHRTRIHAGRWYYTRTRAPRRNIHKHAHTNTQRDTHAQTYSRPHSHTHATHISTFNSHV